MAIRGRPPRVFSGMKFGRLVVLERAEPCNTRHPVWLCSCACGNTKKVLSSNLLNGSTESCGCARIGARATHGMSSSRIYAIWLGMHYRCSTNDPAYGGRGISVCKRWRLFENFYEDMGKTYSSGMTIERVDVNKGYCKSNCKWLPKGDQAKNKRDTIRVIDLCLKDACLSRGMPYNAVWQRVKKLGWSVEEALSTPIRPHKHGKSY